MSIDDEREAERRRGRAMSGEQVTARVLAAVSGSAGTRAGEILPALIRHAHDLAPWEPNGANISRGDSDGEPARIHGRVLGTGGAPVSGAVLDVWGTNGSGRYENVDPAQPDYNLRGRFRSGADGRYDLWTVKPVSSPIPDDGPVGDLLAVTGRHNMRPAHFHVIASAPGYRTIVTELYTDDDSYLDSDAVFGVKPSLVVHYNRVEGPEAVKAAGRSEPYWDLEYDFVLTPGTAAPVGFSTGRQPAAKGSP